MVRTGFVELIRNYLMLGIFLMDEKVKKQIIIFIVIGSILLLPFFLGFLMNVSKDLATDVGVGLLFGIAMFIITFGLYLIIVEKKISYSPSKRSMGKVIDLSNNPVLRILIIIFFFVFLGYLLKVLYINTNTSLFGSFLVFLIGVVFPVFIILRAKKMK